MHRREALLGDLFIHGMGHFHPENRIDNAFLSSLNIGTDEEWILQRVGIRSRRTVLPLEYIAETRNRRPSEAASASLYTNAQTGARAARMALARANLNASQIGLVIAGGCSPQYTIPAEACMIAAELGISATACDLSAACSSFIVQLHHLRMMRPEALPDYILVVNAENNTRTVDYNDRRTAVLWGDASAAAVVSPRVPSRVRAKYSVVESDPSGWNKVVIRTGGHFTQEGSAVQAFAIRKSVATLKALKGRAERGAGDLFMIGHQANLLMLDAVSTRAEINPARHMHNIEDYGNCGAAGAPSVLSQNWEKLSAGSELAMVVVGSGLTWGGALFDIGSSS